MVLLFAFLLTMFDPFSFLKRVSALSLQTSKEQIKTAKRQQSFTFVSFYRCMKLLFSANRFPYPPFRGDKLKIYHLARLLSQKHELHLITFIQDEKDLKHLPELRKYFKKIHLVKLPKTVSYWNSFWAFFRKEPFQVRYFSSRAMRKRITTLMQLENFDAIHVQHLRMAQYWSGRNSPPRILDLPDAYSLYWKRRIQIFSGWKKVFAGIEQGRVFRYENILKDYDLTLVCSKEDAAYLKKEHILNNVAILPNGVDTTSFPNEAHNYQLDKTILFTGNMDYAPNVDAVQYFVKELLPEIRKKVHGLKLIIAGQRPIKKILDLATEDIQVTGFVPDLSALYRGASIVVAPLRFGAGTQNKVLEAMSMGVPVVSGKIGFEGLDIHSGEGVFLAEDNESFIEKCACLLSDADLRKQTGEAGQLVIQNHFSWFAVAKKLEEYFFELSEAPINK